MRRVRQKPSGGNEEWPADSFLGRLTPAEREALLGLGGFVTYAPRERLISEGDEGRFVTFVRSGQVKVVVQDEYGYEHVLGIRSRGSLLGELSYADGGRRSASVVAVTPVRAGSVSWEKFDAYLRDNPRLAMEVARVIALRLRASDQSRRDIRSHSVALRVARLLRLLAEDFCERASAAGSVIELSQGELAQLAQAAEVTVNRVLREFRRRQMVRTAYRQVIVPCVVCLDRLSTALAADPKDGTKGVLGCGGAKPHGSP
jgi:CRP/FNR family cyclic AMP-dependent transcriptional regulator